MCAAKAGLNVAVIGGGWAGCAAAIALARRGSRVTLFDATRTLGGRARAVEVDGRTLDNGQHILLGAYRHTLKMMKRVGVAPSGSLLRLPLQMRYPAGPDGIDFVAARLPAPWHVGIGLLRARGLQRSDKLALARFMSAARWMGWRLDTDVSVSVLLERFSQTARLERLLWTPLCLAALNTPPEQASANVFMAVLRDSLGARRAASDMLIPRRDLSALLPQGAARYILNHGGSVVLGAKVDALSRSATGWALSGSAAALAAQPHSSFDAVVLATAPAAAATLLAPLAGCAGLAAQLHAFAYQPITTCYLQYDPALRLPLPFCALLDNPAQQHFGQFAFDRGQLDPAQAGLLAVVISAAGAAAALAQDALVDALAAQLAQAFRLPQLATPQWSRVITEKRATFACTPGLLRPGNATDLPGLVLAGDYTASDYPATLEAAVRSGEQAAAVILAGRSLDRESSSLSHATGSATAETLGS